MSWSTYGKAIAAVLAAVLMALTGYLSDQVITSEEWIQVSIQAVTAFSVWLTANLPGYTWAKTAAAALLAGLNLLVSAVLDGISMAEWINIGVAVLGVIAVALAPSQTTAASPPPQVSR